MVFRIHKQTVNLEPVKGMTAFIEFYILKRLHEPCIKVEWAIRITVCVQATLAFLIEAHSLSILICRLVLTGVKRRLALKTWALMVYN